MSDSPAIPSSTPETPSAPEASPEIELGAISEAEIEALDPDLKARVLAKVAAGPLHEKQRDFFLMLQRKRDKVKKVRALLGPEPGPTGRRTMRPMEFVRDRDPETGEIQGIRALSAEPRPEGSQPGDQYTPWRATSYDQDGPSSHDVFTSFDEAAKYLADYTTGELAPGTIAAWSKTERWARGVELLAQIQRESQARYEESQREEAELEAAAAAERAAAGPSAASAPVVQPPAPRARGR